MARDLTNGEDGYFCVSEDGIPLVQGEVEGERCEIWIGADAPVQIEKIFGPTIFWSIRVRAELKTVEWVIERNFGPLGEWREVARIPGQLDEDFSDRERH